MKKKLTAKQQRFADEYIKTGNATQAALEAGYSKKTAGVIANENLNKPYIKEYIDKQLNLIHSAKIADAKEIQEFLTSVLRGDETETVATAKGLFSNVELGGKDRLKAAELLGKTKSMFTDRKQIDGDLNISIDSDGEYDAND
ncbi:terminase small subunit [Bombilactobacillus folatiphilus]|uniref:Terminase small subunit n=1 Tax=Bombilactobacillus folatiphilus TaxID=2923362 RepID=A0ABY4PAG2_9LACO|nr:terminase small subunit [Bombilactobacillus folatiphilus]UQS82597.1 terminase small subunit [Bombilactobacillus folatiphilus]